MKKVFGVSHGGGAATSLSGRADAETLRGARNG